MGMSNSVYFVIPANEARRESFRTAKKDSGQAGMTYIRDSYEGEIVSSYKVSLRMSNRDSLQSHIEIFYLNLQ